MNPRPWGSVEHSHALELTWPEFSQRYKDRTWQAYTRRRQYLAKGQIPVGDVEAESNLSAILSNKKTGTFSWRQANTWIEDGQEIKREMSESQDTALFDFSHVRRLRFLTLTDTHIGSWGTDHNLLERITDEILSIPDLYVVLGGDIVHMAIKLRGVLEVSDNVLTPAMQTAYLISWLEEMQDRILFAGWDNHAVIRQENASGTSQIADTLKRKVVYFSGIGHADIQVGSQVYKIAMSHRFRGSSEINPVYGPQKYLRDQGTDRDIAVAGDSHVPGVMSFFIGENQKIAVNGGSTQTNSGFGKRFFSLYTHPAFPVVVLDGEEKIMAPFMSIREMISVMGE